MCDFGLKVSMMDLDTKIKKQTILVVDDELHHLSLLKRTFRKDYNVIAIDDPQKAVEIIIEMKDQISAIICDQRMPKMRGVELLEIAKKNAPDTVRIMLTAFIDEVQILDCINTCEAYAYLVKPYTPDELMQVLSQGILLRNRSLENKTIVDSLKTLFFGTIGAICSALDEKDKYTIGHSHRVTTYALIIGNAMNLNENQLNMLKIAGLLHDIGKIGIKESILNKPGKLTDDEFDEIKTHPEKGCNIIKNLKQLGEVIDWVRYHHERYDGKGYPNRLAGDEIPLGAAILAVADTYDAMTSDRSYRKGLPHEIAYNEIKRCSSTQFNPTVVEAFVRVESQLESISSIKEISEEYKVTNLFSEKQDFLRKVAQ